MPVNVLLRILGDASDANAAVDEAESSVTTFGDGIDWSGLGSRLAAKARPAIKAGLIGAALAIGDWLAEGLSAKLSTPEGAQAQGALDALGAELDKLRTDILDPLLPVIAQVATALIPVVTSLSSLLHDLMPAILPLLGLVGTAITVVAGIVKSLIDGIDALIEGIGQAGTDVKTFLTDTKTAIDDAFAGLSRFFDQLVQGINDLLKPIQDAIRPITDLIDTITGKQQDVHDGQRTSGGFSAGGFSSLGGARTITIHTGADPQAVIAAVRRYAGDNGGPSALARAMDRG